MSVSLQPQFVHVAIGSQSNLQVLKEREERTKVKQLVVTNLTTNEPQFATLRWELKSLPNASLKEKISLLLQHPTLETEAYRKVLKAIACLAAVYVVSVIASRLTQWYLANLHDDILNHRLVYFNRPHEVVGLKYYDAKATEMWGWLYLLTGLSGLGAVFMVADSLKELAPSLKDFLQHPSRLGYYIEPKEPSFPHSDLSELANEIVDTEVRDPITLDGLKSEWIRAPRFIKIGRYLFSLDSLLPRLFFKPLMEGRIAHPLENRPLSSEELENLTTDLSQLFLIDRSEVKKFWDPYYCDWRKVTHTDDLRVVNANKEERDQILQDILLENDLARLIHDWESLRVDQKAFIKDQLRNEIFASRRLWNFLDLLPDNALQTPIKKNDNDSFTLQTLVNNERQRKFTYNVPF
jgi:hypothetical protein